MYTAAPRKPLVLENHRTARLHHGMTARGLLAGRLRRWCRRRATERRWRCRRVRGSPRPARPTNSLQRRGDSAETPPAPRGESHLQECAVHRRSQAAGLRPVSLGFGACGGKPGMPQPFLHLVLLHVNEVEGHTPDDGFACRPPSRRDALSGHDCKVRHAAPVLQTPCDFRGGQPPGHRPQRRALGLGWWRKGRCSLS